MEGVPITAVTGTCDTSADKLFVTVRIDGNETDITFSADTFIRAWKSKDPKTCAIMNRMVSEVPTTDQENAMKYTNTYIVSVGLVRKIVDEYISFVIHLKYHT